MEVILDLLYDIKDVLLILIGAALSIVTTWIANNRQHKMELQRLAVQNKLETSKAAMAWLTEVKSELLIIIWVMENEEIITPEVRENAQEHAKRLTMLGQESRNNFNAIELYYNLDKIHEKYEMGSLISQILSLQNELTEITNTQENYSEQDFMKTYSELMLLVKKLFSAISEIMELIRQDNLNYLK